MAGATRVHAVTKTACLDAVVERLILIGIRGLTATSVHGFGRTSGHESVFRGVAYRIDFQPKTMVEWVGPDDDVDGLIRAILRTAATGGIGDGKIFVTPVDEAARIRTGERGDAAV